MYEINLKLLLHGKIITITSKHIINLKTITFTQMPTFISKFKKNNKNQFVPNRLMQFCQKENKTTRIYVIF